MQAFAALLGRLHYAQSGSAKAAILAITCAARRTRTAALLFCAIAGTMPLGLFKRALVRELVAERVDPVLLALSHDYVGELLETVAYVSPQPRGRASTGFRRCMR